MWWIATAYAWDVNSVDWAYQEARIEEPFLLNADSFAPVGPADEVEALFLEAIATWNAESDADLYVEYGGRTSAEKQGGGDDGKNVAVYGSVDLGAGLAVSTIGYSGKKLNDCDMAFHRRNLYGNIDWYYGEDAAPQDSFDLANTLAHELGHCIGMYHSEKAAAIMYAYNTPGTGEEARHLSDDDRAGVQFLYGAVLPELAVDGAWLEGDVAHGSPVELAIAVRNIGDGSAYFVAGEVDGPGIGELVDLGNIGAPTPVGERVGPDVVVLEVPWTVDCALASLDAMAILGDRRGRSWELATSVPLSCALPEGETPSGDTDAPAPGEDLEITEAEAGGCGCASGVVGSGAAGSGAWILGLLLAVRRRR